MCFQLYQGLVQPFPQALPKQELGKRISGAGRDVLGFRGEARQSPKESQAEVLSAGKNTEESVSEPFH